MWVLVRVLVLFTLMCIVTSADLNLNLTNQKTQLPQRKFNIDAGCNRIFANDQITFESPGYPSGYPLNSDCAYLFKGPICPAYFNFQFIDFNLAASLGCTKDRLEVQDKDALCGTVSGIRSYFSENGALRARFISDGGVSGRGFKILVTRLPCGEKPEMTTSNPNVAWEVTVPTVKPKDSSLPFCCASAYNSKHFFLSSPGFPYSNNQQPGECAYYIYRANANVCRLRIHFLFFWSGEQDPQFGCNRGFLQVDGKFICGCRAGLKLISAFDSRWGNMPKVLTFKNRGFPRSVFSGFAIEVIQDECPKRIAPTDDSMKKSPVYLSDNQVIENRNVFEKALLVKENTEISDGGENVHVYVFEAPDYYDIIGKPPRDVEETTYIDTSGIKTILPDDGYDNNNYKCRIWGSLQWEMLAQEVLWQQMPQCGINKPLSRQCEHVNYIKGFIQSPGYPYYHPGNLNLCYRLGRHPGYCGISFRFVDFNVENSFKCKTDYLLLGGKYRYCGQSLHNSVLTFDLRNKPYEEIYFVTDRYSCGRGFKGVYEQIPCDNTGVPVNPPNPIYPTNPTTPLPPPITPPPPIPQPTPCSRNIQDEFFVIEVYGYHGPRCIFNIQKLNPSICQLSLTFHNFHLSCGNEQLVINNRRYCGQISDQTLNVNFNNYYQLSIIYERLTAAPAITGLRFRLSGQQMNIGCDPNQYPMVPAERSLTAAVNVQNGNDVTTVFKASYTKINDSFLDKKEKKDICGIIFNVPENDITTSICNYLTERNNSTDCVQITAKTIYVPYEYNSTNNNRNNKIKEFDLENFDQIKEVGINEITCDDVYKITDKKS